ncbi:hypothetical protein WBJ53_12845 [Spirosoma sp. SC4-14]|uniref:hypothetical protein n=1 Tax=Spirosoma sp. SC4-14 TaxID=3128900 RepID=UPI0030CD00B9
MDIDELKATWKRHEQKLDSTERLSHQLLQLVLRNRSNGTIDNMIRELRLAFSVLTGLVLFFSAVLAGNPFDYTRPIHFLPAVCYLIIAVSGLYFLVKHRTDLQKTRLLTHDLYHALADLILFRAQHTKLMKRVWMLAMLAGSMIMVPVIARKFTDGWQNTLLVILFPMVLTAVSIGLATLAGMFTDRYLTELKGQLQELEELR